jgi:SAM-dependent methyltransferase
VAWREEPDVGTGAATARAGGAADAAQGAPDAAQGAAADRQLLGAVPRDALTVLDVGCGDGRFGAALKQLEPRRRVYGIARGAAEAERAAARLDRVFVVDVEREAPDLAPGSVDCILLEAVLERLADPLAALRRLVPLLSPGGRVLCVIPNVQHHSVVAALLRGEWQYQDAGLLDARHLRFFTWSSALKLLLDAGLAPRIVGLAPLPADPRLLQAMAPLLAHLGVPPSRAATYLSAYRWTIEGTPLGWEAPAAEEPISFVACVNHDAQLLDNLAASPCLRPGSPHELIEVRGAKTAAEGLEAGRARARHDVVVMVHQDVYLPAGWPARFLAQWRVAEATCGPVGVAGVYGSAHHPAAPGGIGRAGHVLDRHVLLREPAPLPAAVQGLDELLVAVPRTSALRLDPALGFHFYGTDLACQARAAGLRAVVLDAPCFHNSQNSGELSAAFHESGRAFRAKWEQVLPIATPCVLVR